MKTLVCLGDSITDADRIFSSDGLGHGYVRLLAEKLTAAGETWQIINRGVDGFTVSRLLENVQHDCCRKNPDIITILIGINDIGLMLNTCRTPLQQEAAFQKFQSTYCQLLDNIRSQSTAPIYLMEPFIFPWPQQYAAWIPYVEHMSQIIENIGREYQTAYLHLQADLNQLAAKNGYSSITPDGIHLTTEGHRYLAEKLFNQIK